MKEYIEREAVLEKFDDWIDETGALCKGTSYYYESRGCIEAVPAADVREVVHGRWIHSKTYYEAEECNCSLCGQLLTTAENTRMNYCPRCGAKMDLEASNNE